MSRRRRNRGARLRPGTWKWVELAPPTERGGSWADTPLRCWGNAWYQVVLYVRPPDPPEMPIATAQLSLKRWDREQIFEWRDLQRIKDDILGTDVEAVQLFPASARIVDTANQYHLWALPAGMAYPIGYFDGRLTDADANTADYLRAFDAKLKQHPNYVGAKQAKRRDHHTDAGLPDIGLAGEWWVISPEDP